MMKRAAAALLAALLMVTGVGFAEEVTSADLLAEITAMKEQLAALTAEVEALKAQLSEPEEILVGEVDPSLCGKWYLKEVRLDELTIDPSVMGAEAGLTLNEDGTGSLYMSGEEPEEFTWTAKDNKVMLLSDGEVDTIILKNDTLMVEDDDIGMTFVREKAKGKGTKVKRVAALSDFSGEWLATSGSVAGMEMSLEDEDYEIRVIVEGGYVTFSKEEDGKVNERSGFGMLLGGTLTVFGSVGQDDLELQMLEDGRIMLELEMIEDLPITYYFEKIK